MICHVARRPEARRARQYVIKRVGNSMRQRAIPQLAPKPKYLNGDGCYATKVRGLAVLNSPLLNKGSAFTAAERNALGLGGLLPPEISTLGAQVKRAYIQYERLPDALSKNIYLTALHDRNEVLFYRLFSEHLREMIPRARSPPGACPASARSHRSSDQDRVQAHPRPPTASAQPGSSRTADFSAPADPPPAPPARAPARERSA